MKKVCGLLILCVLGALVSCAADKNAAGWYEDFDEAKKAAKSKHCNILLFVNSDNDAEGTKTAVDGLISSSDFVKRLENEYICVHFDFTNLDSVLSEIPDNLTNKEQKALEAKKKKLLKQFTVADSYMIQETPAIVLTNQDGYYITDVALDYMGFSVNAYLSNIDLEKQNVQEFEKLVGATKKGSKLDKVRAIDRLYESMAENHRLLISDLIKKVPVYDKTNQTGLVGKYIVAAAHSDAYNALISGTPENAYKIYEAAANNAYISPDEAQTLFYLASSVLANTGSNDIDKIIELLEKAINVSPESEYAENLRQVYENVLSAKESMEAMESSNSEETVNDDILNHDEENEESERQAEEEVNQNAEEESNQSEEVLE
ncbi:MAG: hypothetical protein HDR51_03645 [Treponema sp.]|nr:hypothetical protein [Treponema sp.]